MYCKFFYYFVCLTLSKYDFDVKTMLAPKTIRGCVVYMAYIIKINIYILCKILRVLVLDDVLI